MEPEKVGNNGNSMAGYDKRVGMGDELNAIKQMEAQQYKIKELPFAFDIETKAVLKQLNLSNKKLAELKGVALTIPNENILINTLTLQEARESSAVENIVTTQDDLYKADLNLKDTIISASTKEVLNYRQALQRGFELVRHKKLLTNNIIKEIQQQLECNSAGFRALPGTLLKSSDGRIVYTPPQDKKEVERLMTNLECFINDDSLSPYDPLIKMAIIHHQFESIHPFYDGNGRTGRIICILYLVMNNLLDIPILYLSRYITRNKTEYYRLLQAIRHNNDIKQWEEWILFMLKGVEQTAGETIELVKSISALMQQYKQTLRPLFGKQYKHELLNNLFFHPYTKIEFVERDMMVQRKTATKYLEAIVEQGLLEKVKIWKTNYYINTALVELFTNQETQPMSPQTIVESVFEKETP